jgi:oligopeptide/dipeptide ABC transporter ATP-binding protein
MRRRPFALAALAVLALIVVGCFGAPWLAPDKPDATNLFGALAGPSGAHLLGTDELGRDILSRLMYGGRATLTEAALVVVVTVGLGVPAGLLAGFTGGWTDRVIMYLADIGLALPVIVIILLVLAIFNGNLQVAMVGLGMLLVPPLARIIRSAAVAVRGEPYVEAARVSGLRPARIMARHVLPRIKGTIVTQATIVAALALLFTTGLGYLGFGPAAPNPSWGGMSAEAGQVLAHSPWLLIASGGAIGITVLCLGIVGDALRDVSTGAWTGQAEPARRRAPRTGRLRHPGRGGHSRRAARGVQATAPPPAAAADALLAVQDLTVVFDRGGAEVAVTQAVSLQVRAGETVGLVGESGCGKTSVARAVIGLLRGTGRVASGHVYFDGQDVTALSGAAARRYRGGQVALITQEPMASLDPSCRVGRLLAQAVRQHSPLTRRQARDRVRELLSLVQLPDPDRVARSYPHELSGGMAQRVAIARALAGSPRLLVADEPTTALDVTLQAEILALLRTLQRDTGLAVLLVSHDWEVVARSCDRVVVMYAGQVVEEAAAADILGSPAHPYTGLLLAASPANAPDGAQTLPVIPGAIPAPEDWPAACHFEARCPQAAAACAVGPIALTPAGDGRLARCVLAGEPR